MIPISTLPSRLVPFRPTQQSTRTVRSESCSSNVRLAVAYGMEAEGLARRIGQPLIVGRDLTADTPRGLSPVLALVRRRGRPRRAYRLDRDHVRLAAARGAEFQSALVAELSRVRLRTASATSG